MIPEMEKQIQSMAPLVKVIIREFGEYIKLAFDATNPFMDIPLPEGPSRPPSRGLIPPEQRPAPPPVAPFIPPPINAPAPFEPSLSRSIWVSWQGVGGIGLAKPSPTNEEVKARARQWFIASVTFKVKILSMIILRREQRPPQNRTWAFLVKIRYRKIG